MVYDIDRYIDRLDGLQLRDFYDGGDKENGVAIEIIVYSNRAKKFVKIYHFKNIDKRSERKLLQHSYLDYTKIMQVAIVEYNSNKIKIREIIKPSIKNQ